MGKTNTTTTQETTVKATPEEQELNRLLLNRQRTLDPFVTDVQRRGLEASKALFSGEELPGYLSGLGEGVSYEPLGLPEQLDYNNYLIDDDITNRIVQQSLADIKPGFQQAGVLDSGVAAELSGELAADIRTQTAQQNQAIKQAIDQYNLENQTMGQRYNQEMGLGTQQFNQGQLLQLLNQAFGGQAQVISPIQASSNQLSQALAGLRTTSTYQNQSRNPFLENFYGSLGSGLGTGVSGGIFGGMGGMGGGLGAFGKGGMTALTPAG